VRAKIIKTLNNKPSITSKLYSKRNVFQDLNVKFAQDENIQPECAMRFGRPLSGRRSFLTVSLNPVATRCSVAQACSHYPSITYKHLGLFRSKSGLRHTFTANWGRFGVELRQSATPHAPSYFELPRWLWTEVGAFRSQPALISQSHSTCIGTNVYSPHPPSRSLKSKLLDCLAIDLNWIGQKLPPWT
jgi:hypothetical protein